MASILRRVADPDFFFLRRETFPKNLIRSNKLFCNYSK